MKKFPRKLEYNAFSLVELLVTLIIASLLISAFAPIMVKKLKASDVFVRGVVTRVEKSEMFSTDCSKWDSCSVCTKDSCIVCKEGYIKEGQECKLQANFSTNCNVADCALCSSSNSSSCLVCKDGYVLNSSNNTCSISIPFCKVYKSPSSCLSCMDGYLLYNGKCVIPTDNCLEYNNTSCTKCKDGYELTNNYCTKTQVINNEIRWKEPESYRDCAPFNAMFVPKEYNGAGGKNLCVTKYNAFDTGGPSIAFSPNTHGGQFLEEVVKVGTSCPGTRCCWHGQTSATFDDRNYNTNSLYGNSIYCAYARTLCTFSAAKSICNFWTPQNSEPGAWRLPTVAEAQGWAAVMNSESKTSPKLSRWMGAGGLQFCEDNTNAKGADKCARSQSCTGAYENLCAPSYIWLEGGSAFSITSGKAAVTANPPAAWQRYAFSVRCVAHRVIDYSK